MVSIDRPRTEKLERSIKINKNSFENELSTRTSNWIAEAMRSDLAIK